MDVWMALPKSSLADGYAGVCAVIIYLIFFIASNKKIICMYVCMYACEV